MIGCFDFGWMQSVLALPRVEATTIVLPDAEGVGSCMGIRMTSSFFSIVTFMFACREFIGLAPTLDKRPVKLAGYIPALKPRPLPACSPFAEEQVREGPWLGVLRRDAPGFGLGSVEGRPGCLAAG